MLETQYKTEDGIANFQAASVTLDTSVKIYSYRVDSVHTETYKVLGGLSRTDARPDAEEGDDAGARDAGAMEPHLTRVAQSRLPTRMMTMMVTAAREPPAPRRMGQRMRLPVRR